MISYHEDIRKEKRINVNEKEIKANFLYKHKTTEKVSEFQTF